jgi:hypothetical protein
MVLAVFFRPTRRKMVLALLIPVYLTYTVHYQMALPPAKEIWYDFVLYPMPLILFYPLQAYSIVFTVSAHPVFSPPVRVLHFLMDYALPLAVDYALACAVLVVYGKIKKRTG